MSNDMPEVMIEASEMESRFDEIIKTLSKHKYEKRELEFLRQFIVFSEAKHKQDMLDLVDELKKYTEIKGHYSEFDGGDHVIRTEELLEHLNSIRKRIEDAS